MARSLSLHGEATFDTPLRVRNRRGGERIKPFGHAHHRDVRLLLQEAGVPPWTRIHLPLIFEGDALIAVADMALSERGHALDHAGQRGDRLDVRDTARAIDSGSPLR